MNDPTNQPIDVEEMRQWLMAHKQTTVLSWSELAKRTGVAAGTISQFGSERGYAGDETRVAETIYRYRQHLAAQQQITAVAPQRPSYFDTETSKYLAYMLNYAQGGRIAVAALGAGLGKTTTAEHYAACYPNVFLATMTPSTAGVNNMQIEILEALGERDAVGTPQKLTRRIKERLKGRSALLIIDEAQHLSEKAIEEIRGWNDSARVGIALFGNESLLQRFGGGSRSAVYAQLFSRIGLRLVRAVPTAADVDSLCDAWSIFTDNQRAFLRRIGQMPGGLRGATFVIELAQMMAGVERQDMQLSHLQDAWAQLSSRQVAA